MSICAVSVLVGRSALSYGFLSTLSFVYPSAAHGSYLVEWIFHGAVAEVIPLLHVVNAQHGAEWIGTAAAGAYFRVDRFNDTEHSGPWVQSIHADQECLFAGIAAFTIELAIRESELWVHAELHP